MASDLKRYLQKIGNQWRVRVSIPRDLQEHMGKSILVEPLHTDSLARAAAMKFSIVAKFKQEIEHARREKARQREETDPLIVEGLEWKESITDEDRRLSDEIDFSVDPPDDPRNLPILLVERAEEIEKSHGTAAAQTFAQIAQGQAIPVASYLDRWLSETQYQERTKYLPRKAIARLRAWLAKESISQTMQSIDRRTAGRFISECLIEELGLKPATQRNYLSMLTQYWDWLVSRGHVRGNPWKGQKIERRKSRTDDEQPEERPFTDAEILTLLRGNPTMRIADLMHFGALTGARIEAICRLRVKDVVEGCLVFAPMKREKASRSVPIHSDLAPIVERRIAGKAPEAFLFDDACGPRANPKRERSQAVVKAFGRYRVSVGVDEKVEGVRRSLVNFHSFRRWFITKAEQAGQPVSTIEALAGHKRTGMTLGVYSRGPSEEQLRACVEAVQLPQEPPTSSKP